MAQAKKKKKFFDVEIPLINKATNLEAFELKELDGKFIKYDLTRTLKGKNALIQLKVKIENDQAIASPRKIRLMPSYLKRMVRKGTNYVEDSFSADCVGFQLKIKPLLITRRKVSRAVRKALRNKCKEELIDYVKELTSNEVFEDILKNKLQKIISLKLKKIYPLSVCEIRVLDVVKEK